jgi:hypothetical protein
MTPVYLPMISNAKQYMVCKIFFALQWWHQKEGLGTTVINTGVIIYEMYNNNCDYSQIRKC